MEIETIEGNKLIAEFMGLKVHANGMCDDPTSGVTSPSFGIKYNSSWDWLMPVWVRYRNLKVKEVVMGLHLNYVARLSQELAYSDTPNEFIKHLIIAIKWYNKEQTVEPSVASKANNN